MEDPDFVSVLVGRVLLARAKGALTVPRLTVVLREVAAARKRAGRPLLYWPILDPGVDAPSPEVRPQMREATDTLLKSCQSMTLIVAGSGLKASLLRTLMRGMVRVGGHAGRVHIAESLEGAVSAAADPEIDLLALQRAARAAGLELPEDGRLSA